MGIDDNFRLAGRGRERVELFRWCNADDFESTEPKRDESRSVAEDRLSTHRMDGESTGYLGDCCSYPDRRDR